VGALMSAEIWRAVSIPVLISLDARFDFDADLTVVEAFEPSDFRHSHGGTRIRIGSTNTITTWRALAQLVQRSVKRCVDLVVHTTGGKRKYYSHIPFFLQGRSPANTLTIESAIAIFG
jgi:hypothetical protein